VRPAEHDCFVPFEQLNPTPCCADYRRAVAEFRFLDGRAADRLREYRTDRDSVTRWH
jgi:hypothetical protein